MMSSAIYIKDTDVLMVELSPGLKSQKRFCFGACGKFTGHSLNPPVIEPYRRAVKGEIG